jgi:hypothetical protein
MAGQVMAIGQQPVQFAGIFLNSFHFRFACSMLIHCHATHKLDVDGILNMSGHKGVQAFKTTRIWRQFVRLSSTHLRPAETSAEGTPREFDSLLHGIPATKSWRAILYLVD